eukprot:3935739-Rhodomonas_salina.2
MACCPGLILQGCIGRGCPGSRVSFQVQRPGPGLRVSLPVRVVLELEAHNGKPSPTPELEA